MLKLTSFILITIFLGLSSFGQFRSFKEFIPLHFTIMDSSSGDINKDGIKDMILVLRNEYENYNTDTTRPLLLLQGNTKGLFKLVGRNDSVVLCMGCGGVHGDPYVGITIKGGYFSIEHFGGSGWRWTRIITFKFNAKTKHFLLHRDAGESWHVSEPNKTTENLFNKDDFGKLSFDSFSYNKNW